MNTLIKNVVLFNQTKDDAIFEEIIKDLNNIIEKHTKQMEKQYQDDLRQEILFTIYNIINKFEIKELYHNKEYLENFKKQYKIDFINDE